MRKAPRSGGLRELAESVVCLAIAVTLVRTFVLEGYLITTGSMAPTLLGHHKQVVCPNCRYRFAVGMHGSRNAVESTWTAGDAALGRAYRDRMLATCPNCRQGGIDITQVAETRGDQLLVHKHAFAFRNPRRWEVMVFRNPQNPREVYVKRIVGLPGEAVQIRDGEIYADGQLQRKSLSQQRALRIPVYNSDYRPGRPTRRWVSEAAEPTWKRRHGGFVFNGLQSTGQSGPAWLVYQHGPDDRVSAESPIRRNQVTDRYGYNAKRDRPTPTPVEDLMLEFTLTLGPGDGRFIVRMKGTSQAFACLVHAEADRIELRLGTDGRVVRSAPIPASLTERPVTMEMSLIDRQVAVALDGRTLFAPWPYNENENETRVEDSGRQVALAAAGLQVRVESLRLFRDVYYTSRRGGNGIEEPCQLNENEFFVLGDNSPISLDSRRWAKAAVPRRFLLGKPLVVHLPSRPGKVKIGEWTARMRLPDFSRMRLVR